MPTSCLRHRFSGRCRRGMTLVEIMMSLIVVALLSLSVATMLYAAGYGTDTRRDFRRAAVRVQQLRLRFDDAIRNAQDVLATDQSTYLVLWCGDKNGTGANKNNINLSEMLLIEYAGGVLTSYTVPAPSTDTTYAEGDDFRAAIKNSSAKVVRPWATGISAVSLAFDDPDPTSANLVTWRLTLTDRTLSEKIVSSVALRSHGSLVGG